MGAVSRDSIVVAVFAAVYLGMLLGRFPRLALDRTGIALLGAIALLASGTTTPAAPSTCRHSRSSSG